MNELHHPSSQLAALGEADLVLFAKAGDPDALGLLLEGVYPSLQRYARSLVGPTAADDVVQDALIQASRKLAWLEEPAYFRAWLFRIASRLAFASLRRAKRWESIEEHTDHASEAVAPPVLSEWEWKHSLEALLERVSPASRAVLLLHYGNDLTLEVIAAALELPVGTVKSRLSYGVAALRRLMNKENR